MESHDYVRHTLDCLEEAQAALSLAQSHGQIAPEASKELAQRIEDVLDAMDRRTEES